MWATIWFYVSGSALLRWLARRIILLGLKELERRISEMRVDASRAELEAQALKREAQAAIQRAALLTQQAEAWTKEHPLSALVTEDKR